MTLDQFYMPAEWQTHRSTWLAWPYDPLTFPQRVEKVEQVFAHIIFYLHQTESVDLIILNESMQKRAEGILRGHQIDLNKITFHLVDYADVWIRDWGPSFLIGKRSRSYACTKWKYNAYGNKFPDLLKDDRTFYYLQKSLDQPLFEAGIVMEGGSFDVNGVGTILTTEQCLLNSNRNEHLSQARIEEILQKFTGASKVIWLKLGIFNDHTDGHIDDIARFVDPHTIVIAQEEDKNDPNYETLEENLHILQDAVDQSGKPFRLIQIPMPKMFYDTQEQAPVSYANFYIANRLVLVPQFHHKYDEMAKQILQSHFPHHRVEGIDCRDLIYGGGTIHCITQQQPLCDSKWM